MNLSTLKNLQRRLAAGFSLTEGLMGVAVMGIVFVSLYTGMATGFKSIRDSRENTRATQIMIEKFETIRLYNWDQINTPGFIPPTFTAKFFPNTTGGTTSTSGSGITYTGRIQITPVPFADVYGADMRALTLSLTWSSDGQTHSRQFTSYVGRYGIQNYVY